MFLFLKWKLNSSNPDRRIAAINELANSGDPHAATLIAQTLVRAIDLAKAVSNRPPGSKGNSVQEIIDHANVQRAAAAALGELRDPCAIDTLLRSLNEGTEAYVRIEAANALGRIKDKRAIAPLLAMLSQWKYSWNLLGGAAAALGEIGDPAAVDPLRSLLSSATERYNDLRPRVDTAYNPNPASRQLVKLDLAEVSAALKEINLALQKLPKAPPRLSVRESAGVSAAKLPESQTGDPDRSAVTGGTSLERSTLKVTGHPRGAWAFLPTANSVVFQDAQRLTMFDLDTCVKRTVIEAFVEVEKTPYRGCWDGVAVSGDGKFLVAWAREQFAASIQLWDLVSGTALSSSRIEEAKLIDVIFVPCTNAIVALCEGNNRKTPAEGARASVFTVPSLTLEQTLLGSYPTPRYNGQGEAVSPDGKLLVVGDRVFDVQTGSLAGQLECPRRSISGIQTTAVQVGFTTDGSKIITGEQDGNARLWDASTQRLVCIFQHGVGGVDGVAVAVSPDGSMVATSQSGDSEIKLWDATSGRQIRIFKSEGGVCGVVFSPDGRAIATKWGSICGTAWEVKSGRRVAQYEFRRGTGCWITFSPDSRFMAVTDCQHSGPHVVTFADLTRLLTTG